MRLRGRRAFLREAAAGYLLAASPPARAGFRPPNIVLLLADDLGYRDLGCYGSRIPTPNLDRMASEGALLRHFYSASPVCSPSRAALMTGRYPGRTGLDRVLFPNDPLGLPQSETSIAKMLKAGGYRTMCVGKWHLGDQARFLPPAHGFDEFYGVPYSHDMYPLPLLHDGQVVEETAQPELLTQRFTAQAVRFLSQSQDAPFFLYVPFTAPHLPFRLTPDWQRRTRRGPYGDTIAEMDWGVGQIMQALKDTGKDSDTLVLFTSDNGPWYQGSAGDLQGRKGETFEGGVREPFLARWPGVIPAGLVSSGVASMLDLLPTFASLAGSTLPSAPLDGIDITPLLTGAQGEMDREALLYFDGKHLQCARLGRWKLHVARYSSPPWMPEPASGRLNLPLPNPELYDLVADPSEGSDVSAENPDIVADLQARIQRLLSTFPAEIVDDWRDTVARPVEDTPAGAPPVLKTS